MKRNKTFLGVALLVAVLMLGVGYAAITDLNLNISGTASASADGSNFSVKFTNATTDKSTYVLDTDSKNVVVTPVGDGTEASLTVTGLTTKGDKVTAVYTITNESTEIGASVTIGNITNSNTEYFSVTTDKVSATPVVLGINAGENKTNTTTVTVTVELIKTPATDVSTNITIPFTAEAVAA